jgi:signal transduction histidine kinase
MPAQASSPNPEEWRPAIDEPSSRDELRRQANELRESRARLMAMANGQRRDIERDLHDGVQQDLVALAVSLQLAEELAGSDPAAVGTLLAEARQDLGTIIERVRALARRIYPPLLAGLGLADALRGAASGVGIPVRVDATVDRYPTDIEATVFFACVEALETMASLAPSGRATLRVWGEHESVLFEVMVEGEPPPGDESVLNSVRTRMDDRIGAHDGSLAVFVEHEAIRLRGMIPLLVDSSLTFG